MSKISSVRKTLNAVIGKTTRAADSNVVPFPKKAVRKKRKPKPAVVKKIFKDPEGGHSDVHGNRYEQQTINGKVYMRRDDGALFKLQPNGKWVHVTSGKAGGGARKKAGGGFGKVLPYAAAAGAAAAGGAYLATRKK